MRRCILLSNLHRLVLRPPLPRLCRQNRFSLRLSRLAALLPPSFAVAEALEQASVSPPPSPQKKGTPSKQPVALNPPAHSSPVAIRRPSASHQPLLSLLLSGRHPTPVSQPATSPSSPVAIRRPSASQPLLSVLPPAEEGMEEYERFMSENGNLKGAMLKAEGMARAALFLASDDDAGYVSGLNLVVDGGFSVVNPSFAIAMRSTSNQH